MGRMIERSAAVEAVEKLASERIAELPNGFVNAIFSALNDLPPARFTREDVEKALVACLMRSNGWTEDRALQEMGDDHEGASVMRNVMTAALSAIGEVEHG